MVRRSLVFAVSALLLALSLFFPPSPAWSANSLAGVWRYVGPEGELVVEIGANGLFRQWYRHDGLTEQAQGSWRTQGGMLLVFPTGGEPMRFGFSQPDENTLVLQEEAGPTPLRREAALPGWLVWPSPPPPLETLAPAVPPSVQPAAPSGGYGQPGGPAGTGGVPGGRSRVGKLYLEPWLDRTENAFTVLVPHGWMTMGGMLRVNPLTSNGPAQTLEAKIDFAVLRDPQGAVMVRWLPHIYYTEMTGATLRLPPGSNYMGMTVLPYPTPDRFVLDLLLPAMRPMARNVRALDVRPLPSLAAVFFETHTRSNPSMRSQLRFDAALVALQYEENGVSFQENVLIVLENMGPLALGQWCNRYTLAARAPAAEFRDWEPVLWLISQSTKPNPQWVQAELRAMIQRGQAMMDTQRYLQDGYQSIMEHRRRTNEEIRNDMYLMVSGQEDYINPYTGEVETATNEWKNRWVNSLGHVIYTDDPAYDPNADPDVRVRDFRRSEVRPRF